jgi:hypothetical protein
MLAILFKPSNKQIPNCISKGNFIRFNTDICLSFLMFQIVGQEHTFSLLIS